jgi:hypothetical protein
VLSDKGQLNNVNQIVDNCFTMDIETVLMKEFKE